VRDQRAPVGYGTSIAADVERQHGSGAAQLVAACLRVVDTLDRWMPGEPNNALAAEVGIAASTCLGRVRALQDRGVIRGFHAEVDIAALGYALQAMISVRFQAHSRDQVDRFRQKAPRLPGVLSVFHVAGADDFLMHVAAPTSDALRDFVLDHLTTDPAVRHAETSLIFEHVRA
jgi:DNA-binding Lrp family transcriptional regulator